MNGCHRDNHDMFYVLGKISFNITQSIVDLTLNMIQNKQINKQKHSEKCCIVSISMFPKIKKEGN